MPLTLDRIRPAPERIRDGGRPALRRETYLRTYPSLLDLVRQQTIDETRFHQLACATYGWMPRIGRLNPAHIEDGLRAIRAARAATRQNWRDVGVATLAECVHSVVGASKMLHFVNPSVFPIWDSRVEAFRHENGPLRYNHMSNVEHYFQYVCNVWHVICEDGFDDFLIAMNNALRHRLDLCQVAGYDIGEVRAVELAAFELSL